MMRMNRLFEGAVMLSLLLITSCGNNEEPAPPPELTLTVENATFSIDENPEPGQVIGQATADAKLDGKTQPVTFELISQSVLGAVAINNTTGELTVDDVAIFDFEKNESLSLSIEATAGDSTETADVEININNLLDEWQMVGEDERGLFADDRFGVGLSMNMDGTYLAIGAPDFGRNERALEGRVTILNRNSIEDAWIRRDYKDGENSGDRNGHSVAINDAGDRLVIGSYSGLSFIDEELNASVYAGHVRIFNRDGDDWLLEETIGAEQGEDGFAEQTRFGQSVAMNAAGDQIAIGAPAVTGSEHSNGHSVNYALESDEWLQLGNGIDGSTMNEFLGRSVSLSADGNIQAIGAHGYSGQKGQVQVFELSGDTWSQIGASIEGENDVDRMGVNVKLSNDGKILAVGADQRSEGPGFVKVFMNEGETWVQMGSTLEGAAGKGGFGHGLALSGDGKILVAGAPNSSVYGERAGYARIYRYDEEAGDWIQVGEDIEGAVNDRMGLSVAINDDGTAIVISADEYYKSEGTGYVRTYMVR